MAGYFFRYNHMMHVLIISRSSDLAEWEKGWHTHFNNQAFTCQTFQADRNRSVQVHELQAAGIDITKIDYLLLWGEEAAELIPEFTQLKAVISLGAGVNHVVAQLKQTGKPLYRLLDAGMAEQMADYALYWAYHFMRDMDRYQRQQARSNWEAHSVATIDQWPVTVLGVGKLGQAVVTRLQKQGFKVSGWSRSPKDIKNMTSYAGIDQLQASVSGAKLVYCLLPLTEETTEILNLDLFEKMAPGSVLINVARGAQLRERDLLTTLDRGHLRGAVLDVFQTEPLNVSHAFWQHPAIWITPHSAANTRIEPALEQIHHIFDAITEGDTGPGLVDYEAGY